MTVDAATVAGAVTARLADAQAFLAHLISIPSLSGQEAEAVDYVADAFSAFAAVERMPLHDALRDDRDYSDPIPDLRYEGRDNLRIRLAGRRREARALLLNTHLDTVPPAQGQVGPYAPEMREGRISGRGACDAKGQAATIFLAMAALSDLGVPLDGDLIAHLVVEEENGGNGTLAMARAGEQAAGCIVLEPTELKILPSVRGAVWFRMILRGKAGHSGTAERTRSALHMAVRAIRILEDYHAELLAQSKGIDLFDRFDNPMPLTIGQLHAGNWPASAPSEACLEGVLGFLPNRTAAEAMQEMRDALRTAGGPEMAENITLHFSYRHDASICPKDHDLVTALSAIMRDTGCPVRIAAMPASCDAWLYNNRLRIPTVVFGGGSLGVAHSSQESMPIDELAMAGRILAGLAIAWCAGSRAATTQEHG